MEGSSCVPHELSLLPVLDQQGIVYLLVLRVDELCPTSRPRLLYPL